MVQPGTHSKQQSAGCQSRPDPDAAANTHFPHLQRSKACNRQVARMLYAQQLNCPVLFTPVDFDGFQETQPTQHPAETRQGPIYHSPQQRFVRLQQLSLPAAQAA